MKRVVSLFVFLLGGLVASQAQDLIATKRGENIQARILEISTTEVKYKRYGNLDGPIFIINKSEVEMVCFENGEIDIFEAEPALLNTDSDIYVGMKYRELKEIYDRHYYVPEIGDTYSRGWAGVASLFIPGLGQCVCGEWGRGASIFASYIGLGGLTEFFVKTESEALYPLAVVTMTGTIALGVWSIIDAVQVAQVKNMYYQDLRKMRTSVSIMMEPCLTYTPTSSPGGCQPAAGLALKVSF